MTVTLHLKSTGTVLGSALPVSMTGGSLTIGRGSENDLVLPDPERMISVRHCAIEDRDGSIVVIDFSTNGTFLNHNVVALGTVATPLNHGDILSIGQYELLVEISAAESSPRLGKVLPQADIEDPPGAIAEPMGMRTVSEFPDATEVADHFPFDAPMAAPAPAPGDVVPHFDDLFLPQHAGPPAATPNVSAEPLRPPRPVLMRRRPNAPESEMPSPRWRRGNALFRIPRVMWTETAELAELRLTPHDALTVEMRALLERSMVGRGTQTDEHAVSRVGTRMKAALHADPRDIEVTPLGTDVQVLEDDAALGWDWRVVPLREGPTLVTLRLTMLADLDGRETALDAQALHTSVEVTVRTFLTRPRRFVRDNWRWMLGSSGIGAVAALWALFAA